MVTATSRRIVIFNINFNTRNMKTTVEISMLVILAAVPTIYSYSVQVPTISSGTLLHFFSFEKYIFLKMNQKVVVVCIINSFIFIVYDVCEKWNWNDVKKDCGGCKALIRHFDTRHKTCENYCDDLGLWCVNSYEEASNSCVEELRHPCDTKVKGSLKKPSNDVICECTTNSSMSFDYFYIE